MSTFENFGLSDQILASISDLGFKQPTPIQEKAIPHILQNDTDLVALAETGSGKTAAFGLPILQKLNPKATKPQALILSPTRELALQICKDLQKFAANSVELSVTAVYGGASIEFQIKDLKRGTQIVVGTPGRVLDLIKRKSLKLDQLKWLVLDEADEMLSMGFKDELDAILESTPEEKRTFLFSATMPKEISMLSKKFMQDAAEITIGKKNQATLNVEHQYYVVRSEKRYEALKRIADMNPGMYAIVFCRTRSQTKEVADQLMQDGYNADALHGDLSQAQRDFVMDRFRLKHLQILVATDVAARGLDVTELTHVINYAIPNDSEIYIHRSGRTGRAGNTGIACSIVHVREARQLMEMGRKIGIKINRQMIPDGRVICEKQLYKLIEKVENVEINESQIAPFLEDIYNKLEVFSREELIQKFVSVEFNRFLQYYKNTADLNINFNEKGGDKRRDDKVKKDRGDKRKPGMEYTKLYLTVGSKQGLNNLQMIGLIKDNSPKRRIDIGKIDIDRKFSFVEVEKQFADQVLENLNGYTYQSVAIEAKVYKGKDRDRDRDKDRRDGRRDDRPYSKKGGDRKFKGNKKKKY